MTWPENLAATGLSRAEVGVFLNGSAALVVPIKSDFPWRPQLRDPDDEIVLEAAVNGHGNAIVTFNLRDFRRAAAPFGIEVEQPGDIIRRRR